MIYTLPLFFIYIYCLGTVCLGLISKSDNKESNFESFVVNSIIGFTLFLLTSHLISFFLRDFDLSCKIVLFIYFIGIAVLFKKIHLPRFTGFDIAVTALGILIGMFMGIRDFNFGNPDNFHIALTASVSENSIYPPIFPSDADFSMSSYHYGVELIGSIFKSLFNLSIWDAHSVQIFFGTVFCFVSMYCLANIFLKDRKLSLVAAFFATFFTSINSLEFLLKELFKIADMGSIEFLRKWLLVSWTSVSHMTSQLRLPSQSSAFFYAFLLLYLIYDSFKNNNRHEFPIILFAFGLYFTFPAFFYPLLASTILVAGYDFYKTKKYKISLGIIISLILGKLLTFTGGFADAEGVKALVLSPDLYWLHWGKSYIRYFYDQAFLSQLSAAFDYANPAYHIQIPLFSTITIREFGFCALISLVFVGYKIKKKESDAFLIVYLTALISCAPPFILDFIPRPIETTRFLHLSKILFVFFFFTLVIDFLAKSQVKKVLKIALFSLAFIICIPGYVSVLPIHQFIFNGNNKVKENEKKLIDQITKFHKTGDICLDNIDFKHGHNLSELAGFYGIGGQMYKQDKLTRATAVKLLNPILLKELNVDYLLISSKDELSNIGKQRLLDKNLFIELPEVRQENPNYAFYSFNKKIQLADNYMQDYQWLIGCNEKNVFLPIRKDAENFFSAKTKAELLKLKSQIKPQIAQKSVPCAYWLSVQAAPLQ